MNELFGRFMKYRFVEFMYEFLMCFMNDWLMDFSDFFFVNYWLMNFMDQWLVKLMNNVFVVLVNNVLVMFMNYIPMMFFYNWLVCYSINSGCCLSWIYKSLSLMPFDNWLLIVSYYSCFWGECLLNYGDIALNACVL